MTTKTANLYLFYCCSSADYNRKKEYILPLKKIYITI